ncbi:MAG: methionine--tRNA ligase [Alphaproteobacteria bacterium]|nr:methionine--tRNA ligase [Alphaproteobacteria bacterium]MDD9920492.1 methionine--tRNA ligase [Alphaproteobacteria bacterium]
MTQKAYITTPIYYPSGAPHVGSAYTSTAADVWARFKRSDGFDTKFLTGTDEHGLKLQRKAEEAGLTPQDYVDDMSTQFRALTDIMNLSNDDFIRTTEPRHHKAAQAIWQKLAQNGYIYKDTYSGWYCVSDEAYYDESELTEQDGKKIAPSGHPVEWMEEESYFFKLSAFEDKLLALYEEQPDFIQPNSRRNEVISFVKSGLADISISRTTFDWGIPVPNDDKHVMYVWIDALTNYLTADGYPNELNYWPAVHLVGKDILRFHAIYWPAMLMGADIDTPRKVFAHGWWTSEGKKMSKSFGNVVDPKEITEEFGIDAVRYFMLREVPFGNDGDFSRERMINRINTELANDLGNLFQRVLSMVQKNCDGKTPALGTLSNEDKALLELAQKALDATQQEIEALAFHKALDAIWEVIDAGNKYMDAVRPWELKKTNPAQMAHVLRVLMESFQIIAVLVTPFMPESGEKLLSQLGISGTCISDLSALPNLKEGTELPVPQGIFPRIDVEKAA